MIILKIYKAKIFKHEFIRVEIKIKMIENKFVLKTVNNKGLYFFFFFSFFSHIL